MYAYMLLLEKRISEKINQKLTKMVTYERWECWGEGNREENENCLRLPFNIVFAFEPRKYFIYSKKSKVVNKNITIPQMEQSFWMPLEHNT